MRLHHRIVILSLILSVFCSLSTCSCSNAGEPPGNDPPPKNSVAPPKFIPWVEVNSPGSPFSLVAPEAVGERAKVSLLDDCIEGLGTWSQVTDTAIVTTRPGHTEYIYGQVMRRKELNLRIIGGLKTYTLPGTTDKDKRTYDYADAEGWVDLTKEALLVARLTGTNIVVFENETALGKFHTGEGTIDLAKLTKSLAPLRDSGLEIWWALPSVQANNKNVPTREELSKHLVRTMAEAVPKSRFITGYLGWNDADEIRRREEMIKLVGADRMLDMLYVTPDGYLHYSKEKKKRCLNVAESLTFLSTRPGQLTLIYPGAVHWVSVSREYATHCPRRTTPDG